MVEIKMFDKVGEFAENKDVARDIMIDEIRPALKNNEPVILNFRGVNSATQSFIHALLSGIINEESISVLDKIEFKNCNNKIKQIISIVIDYMQTRVG